MALYAPGQHPYDLFIKSLVTDATGGTSERFFPMTESSTAGAMTDVSVNAGTGGDYGGSTNPTVLGDDEPVFQGAAFALSESSIRFDGVSQYAEFDNTTYGAAMDAGKVAMIFTCRSTTTVSCMVAGGLETTSTKGFQIQVNAGSVAGRIRIWQISGSSAANQNDYTFDDAGFYTDGNWQTMVVLFDKTGAAGERIKLWIDGALVRVASGLDGASMQTIGALTRKPNIGCRNNAGTRSNFFAGDISRFIILQGANANLVDDAFCRHLQNLMDGVEETADDPTYTPVMLESQSTLEPFWRAARTRRVAAAMLNGDSNGRRSTTDPDGYSSQGHVHGMIQGLLQGTDIQVYATRVFGCRMGGAAGSSFDGVTPSFAIDTPSASPPSFLTDAIFVDGGLPSAGNTGFAWGAFGTNIFPYYNNDYAMATSSTSNVGIDAFTPQNGFPLDLTKALRIHLTYGTFAAGTGAFKIRFHDADSDTESVPPAVELAINSVTGSDGIAQTYLDIPAAARSGSYRIRPHTRNVDGVTGPWCPLYMMIEDPSITTGIQVSDIFSVGGVGMRYGVTAMVVNQTQQSRWEHCFDELTRLQGGDKDDRMLLLIIPQGQNDVAESANVASIGTGVGSVLLTVSAGHSVQVGSHIRLVNTTTTPVIDGDYTVITVPSTTTFTITATVSVAMASGSSFRPLATEEGGANSGLRCSHTLGFYTDAHAMITHVQNMWEAWGGSPENLFFMGPVYHALNDDTTYMNPALPQYDTAAERESAAWSQGRRKNNHIRTRFHRAFRYLQSEGQFNVCVADGYHVIEPSEWRSNNWYYSDNSPPGEQGSDNGAHISRAGVEAYWSRIFGAMEEMFPANSSTGVGRGRARSRGRGRRYTV